MAKSKSKTKSIIRPTMVILKGLQAAGDTAPFPYIKGVAALALTVLEIVDAASTNRKDIDEFAERIGNTITTLKNVADRYLKAGDDDISDLQGLCEDFQRCLQDIIHDLREIHKMNTDKIKIIQYLMITDVRDKISTFIQRANNLQRDSDTGIVTETRAIVSSIRRDTKSGLVSIKSSLDRLHLATEDGYTTLEQRLYVALRNDLGPLISRNHGDLLTAIEDSRGIYKGLIRDITMGDINLGYKITSFIENSATHSPVHFFEHHCTVNGDAKIARVYRCHQAYEEEGVKILYRDLEKMLYVRHENVTQLFGVCRTAQFPVLIFHDRSSHNRTVHEHCLSLDMFQLMTFGVQLMRDMRSAYYHVKSATGTLVPYNYRPTAVCVDSNGRILLDVFLEDPNAPLYHWTRLACELLGREPPVLIPRCIRSAPWDFDDLHYCSHVQYDLLRCYIPVHDIMDENVMASLLAKAQELTASGLNLRKDNLPGLYSSFRGVTLGTVLTTEERFNLGSIIGLQKLVAKSRQEIDSWFAQAVRIPREHRHIGREHLGVDWYSALLFDVRFALEIDQAHVSENDVDLPQMYARYAREVNDAFPPPSPTDDNFGIIYLTVRPPRDMLTPGPESASYKPEFLWSLTPNFQETLSSEIVEKVFHIMIRETAVYGACILERRDYKFLRALHEACGFDRDGEDISRFFEFPRMTMYPCQPYPGYRYHEWPTCRGCLSLHTPIVDNFGIDWKTPPPSPLSSRSSSPFSDLTEPTRDLSCEPELEASALPFHRNYRRELLRSIVGLVLIFIISKTFLVNPNQSDEGGCECYW
ncbi:hypothetical protein IW261DRAFT_1570686 [Armillaria novae-zelandiae]|uniref:Uncharacterized protein n=1 Tax=Armillaria novae-zelandiae TaxID=153914 RepID=A0AA39NVN3_9AGAR|nr:hypothetical protein IW261DRAFT_1570686 [Armillaria novae-zelandiae]